VVKEWENRLKALKYSIQEPRKRISFLSRGKGSIATQKKQGKDTIALEHELAELLLQVEPIEEEITAIEEQLKPYNEIKEKLKGARGSSKAIRGVFKGVGVCGII
jgi:chromosome segregation ATPase